MELSSEGRPCLAEMDGWRAGEGFVKSAILVLLLGFLGASTTLRPLKEMAFATSGSWLAVIVHASHLILVRYLVNYFFGLDMPTNEYTAYSYCTIFSSIRGKKKSYFYFFFIYAFF